MSEKKTIETPVVETTVPIVSETKSAPQKIPSFGVCDNPSQFAERYSSFHGNLYCFPIFREGQSPHGGWRWHKWGPYVGEHQQTVNKLEYLYEADGTIKNTVKIDVQYIFSTEPCNDIFGCHSYKPVMISGGIAHRWDNLWSDPLPSFESQMASLLLKYRKY